VTIYPNEGSNKKEAEEPLTAKIDEEEPLTPTIDYGTRSDYSMEFSADSFKTSVDKMDESNMERFKIPKKPKTPSYLKLGSDLPPMPKSISPTIRKIDEQSLYY
jgi:hypothetical protein